MSTLAQPMMPAGRWHPARVTAGVLCFVALVLVISSSFLPLYSGELDVGFDSTEVTITPWTADYGEVVPDGMDDVPRVGYPMVVSAVILACAAAACWYAASPGTRPAAARVAGLLTATGGAFLAGTAWTTALLVNNGVDTIILLGTLDAGLETEATYLVGYWLLLVSCLLAFAAVVLALLPSRGPRWQPVPPSPYLAAAPVYGTAYPRVSQLDPMTGRPIQLDPRTGRPLPFPSPPAPPAGPFLGQVDPLTGQPVGQVMGQPAAVGQVVDPLTGQPVPVSQVDPLTGQPLPQRPAGPPLTHPMSQGGLPVSGTFPAGPPGVVGPVGQGSEVAGEPVLGQSWVQGSVAPVGPFPAGPPGVVAPVGQGPKGAAEPVTAQPGALGPVIAPAGPVSPPGGLSAPVPPDQPVLFTTEPVGPVNGTAAVPVEPPALSVEPVPPAEPVSAVEPVPIVLPGAPPPPETPPGPAVPATEDPLAEPPRT